MNFTIGIITELGVWDGVLESIISQKIPEFEIIIVGGDRPVSSCDIRHIPFDESIKKGWITKKKNIITSESKYDNIVYIHDYYALCDGWYDGFVKFGNDWDIAMNIILNKDGSRFRDWCAWDDPDLGCLSGDNGYSRPVGKMNVCLPSYSYDKKQYMYISGGYWVAKKRVMEEQPLDEAFVWGSGFMDFPHHEDVEWSMRTVPYYDYKMNVHSKTKTLKEKELYAREIDFFGYKFDEN